MKRSNFSVTMMAAVLMAAASQGVWAAPGDTAAVDPVKACGEFPKGHPYSCEKLAAMDAVKACNEFPKGHPYSCEKLAAMDAVKACNELPADHPYGCRRLLSLVPKCPPGQTTCKHMLVKNEGGRGFLTDGEGRKVTAASLGSVRAAALSGIFAPASD